VRAQRAPVFICKKLAAAPHFFILPTPISTTNQAPHSISFFFNFLKPELWCQLHLWPGTSLRQPFIHLKEET
jgi:hypothetical protein